MNFSVSAIEGRCVIASLGDIIGEATEEFSGAIKNGIESGSPAVILDLSKTTIIDSAGISAIVANIGLLKQKKCRLILAGCQEAVSKIFQLVGFSAHFPIVKTVDEAVKMAL